MSEPDISIVIPYLNQPEFLGNCLASLAAQKDMPENVEIIVVDNGSRELPTETCAPYPNVRIASEATPGPGPARNAGIGLAKSSLLAFIDADCIADPNWISAVIDAFRDPEVQVIGGDVRIALVDPHKMTALEAYESVYAYRQKLYIEKMGFSGTGNLAMRRPVHEDVGPFAGIGVAEDREWGQRATAKGYVIRYVPDMIVFHPARKTMAELRLKWERHMSHDYEEQVRGGRGKIAWTIKTAAMAASPLWEWLRIARSPRLNTLGDRVLAFAILTRIRWFRSLKMFGLLASANRSQSAHGWNRNG